MAVMPSNLFTYSSSIKNIISVQKVQNLSLLRILFPTNFGYLGFVIIINFNIRFFQFSESHFFLLDFDIIQY